VPAVPRIDEPPADVAFQLRRLRDGLDEQSGIPAKRLDHNLLVATWNIRAFGDLTEKWSTGPGDSPKRNLADVRAIADVVSRFDVVAVQETRGTLRALRETLSVLGENWGLILTDVTRGRPGNDERLAFIFDLRRVKPSGLACELVVPQEELDAQRISEDALRRQFARTPYAVSFQSASHTFTLVTLHVLFGAKPADRIGELRCIAEWLAKWAGEADSYGQNLIVLGDFNIDRKDDPNYQAFTSKGLRPPPELDDLPRTTADLPGKISFFDQIAWFHDGERSKLNLQYTGHASTFKWTDHYLQDEDPERRTFRMSDHYPLWAEFSIRD
jgi:endonuclease/exonuclease/phosphatase family metal-dependent hydrolase